jgi:hypothetical protein
MRWKRYGSGYRAGYLSLDFGQAPLAVKPFTVSEVGVNSAASGEALAVPDSGQGSGGSGLISTRRFAAKPWGVVSGVRGTVEP